MQLKHPEADFMWTSMMVSHTDRDIIMSKRKYSRGSVLSAFSLGAALILCVYRLLKAQYTESGDTEE